MQIKLEILGNPLALKRHRTFRRGNFVGQYDPSQNEKKDFLLTVQNKAPEKPITGSVMLTLVFFMARPKGHYGTGKNTGILKPNTPLWHTKRPDLSNLTKFVEDALNGIFWSDDSVISKLTAIKIYDEKPRTEILIES